MEIEHRADALLTLPALPERIAVLGDPPGWRRDLEQRDLAIVSPGPGANVIVSDEAHIGEALAAGAPHVVVDGSRRAARSLGAAGFRVARLLPVPVAGTPLLYVDLAQRRAARYGIEHALSHAERWRAVRNRVAAKLAGIGLLPPVGGIVSVGSRTSGPPALVAAGRELGIDGSIEWAMLVSPGSAVRRNAFLLFPPRARRPSHVIKVGRLRGLDEQFARERRGAQRVAQAGGVIAAHAPRYLGATAVGGHRLSVETAAVGTKLSSALRRPASSVRKLALVEPIASWLPDVAASTAQPPSALAAERARLAQDVLPFWSNAGVDGRLADDLAPVPATFQHNDLAEENVVVDGAGFTVLDWEWAKPDGLPLGDLVYFGVHVLRIIDGAEREADRDRYFVDLLAGRAAGSPVFFRWLHRLVETLNLAPEAVAPLVTLSLLDRGRLSAEQRVAAEQTTGTVLDAAFGERMARLWLSESGLGPSWNAWRS